MSAPSTPSVPFDARPLTEPVDRATARAYVRELRRTGRAPRQNPVAVVLAVTLGAVMLVMFLSVFGAITAVVAGAARSAGGGLFAAVPFFFLLVLLAIVVLVVVRVVRAANGARWYRLDRFAQANGMTWYPEANDPPLPGMIFGVGHSRRATDIVRGERPRLVEFANYSYKTGSGKNETTSTWGYVAVKLATPLPHIVLDATGNNSVFGSNLPASFDRHQRLGLEGDFDRYFTLYCPAGYERDALYLFTPDVMARFIDTAAALDVEIVDDWLFLYTSREASTVDPATWAWLFSVVRAILDKLAQWERWRDDRLDSGAREVREVSSMVAGAPSDPAGAGIPVSVGLPFAAPTAALRPPGVAAPGRRLRQGVPWRFIVLGAGVLLLFVLTQMGAFAGILGAVLR
ncbi:hypothetical protein [Microbacterium dextranolyticum]|uniref:DUF3137 domain-containing protein n=1 Tax=Microbacterium dextranolyticum TaxID=36806 RepID=A0A9W6HK24_9MICO|nr:hypothetical protein [Microbacterium dextranolyticum]MBM7461643.1 hypothetical protein [Microbacterium dextranolyticum]GLJ94715.1 hypothetical protein GCM10017591_07770 [Microbacterium dextranolyticum]